MRVLAHIHTYNSADSIDATIESLLQQTRPLDEILVIDNVSTDDTLARPSLCRATVIRHQVNTGCSGAIATGMRYALDNDYDWLWVLDADAAPRPNTLQKLLDLYAGWPQDLREETGFLAGLSFNQRDGLPFHGSRVTPFGRVIVSPAPEDRCYPCDVTIWSGNLYRLAAVRRVGLPNPDYFMDWGEYEYGYRVKKAGYKAFVCQDAVIDHNIAGIQSLSPRKITVGPFTVTFYDNPVSRCYYLCRNTVYFTLYDYESKPFGLLRPSVWRIRSAPGRPGLMRGLAWQLLFFITNFMVRPRTHGSHIAACLRGIWHGLTRNMAARY